MARIFLFSAFALVLLTTACAEATATTIATSGPIGGLASPTALGTDIAGTPIGSPEATVDTTATIDTATPIAGTDATPTLGTDVTATSGVPVTGVELILLECQFCIEDTAHAVLVLPDTASFETVADTTTASTPGPDMGCNTVDTYNGRQVVVCRSVENTSMNLNICTDGNNCAQLLVELQDCPNVVQPGVTDTPGAGDATSTPEVGLPTNTAVGDVSPTPLASPTATPQQ